MSFDPIEAAKVREGGGKKLRALRQVEAEEAQAAEEAEAKPAPQVSVPDVAVPLPKRYRIKAARQVSVNGAVTWVAAGQIIDPAGYGLDHVMKLMEQGVELEEIA